MTVNFNVSASFRCSQTTLWRYIQDPSLQTLWIEGLDSVILEGDDRVGPGSRFCMNVRDGDHVAVYRGVVLHCDDERRFTVRISAGCFDSDMALVADYRLARGDAHVVRLHYAEHVEGVPIRVWLLSLLYKRHGRRKLQTWFETLRRLVETPVTAAAG